MKISRRVFLISSGTAAAAVPTYAKLCEPSWLEVTEKTVPLPADKLKRPLRLLHLSDLHASPSVSFSLIREAIELGLARKPDLICLTGDYITGGHLRGKARYSRLLSVLAGSAPVYASFGNHDGGLWAHQEGGLDGTGPIRRLLEGAGITCLHDEATVLRLDGQDLNLVGISDLWSGPMHPDRAFDAVASRTLPTIVLSHNPDTTESLGRFDWDLQLSGHTHGGQVVIPVLNITPYVPIRDRRFIRGLCPWKGRYVHVTRGVGSILGIRLNCRPEVSILNLEPIPA